MARGEDAGAKPYAVDVVMANRAPMAVLNFIVGRLFAALESD
jgi:hypothetical protein